MACIAKLIGALLLAFGQSQVLEHPLYNGETLGSFQIPDVDIHKVCTASRPLMASWW